MEPFAGSHLLKDSPGPNAEEGVSAELKGAEMLILDIRLWMNASPNHLIGFTLQHQFVFQV